MGWKGALRSMAAASRAAERDSRRRQRELEARQKYYEKMEELEQAAHDVEVYENYIDRITSIHRETRTDMDWQSILSDPQPNEPVPSHDAETFARKMRQNYRPGFFAKLFGLADRKVAKLERDIKAAKAEDEGRNKRFLDEYRKDLAEFKEQADLTPRVLANEPEAYAKALRIFGAFSEIEDLGSHLAFRFTDHGLVYCTVKVHSKEIIPEQSRSLLKSGRLSQKNIPKGRFFELYQDYVCGVVLRVANETLSVLPVEEVVVTASDDLLDTKTGHIEEQPIVSALIPRRTIRGLNMTLIDPSDSLANFVCQMSFKKTQGFSAVKEVEPPERNSNPT